MSEQRWKKDRLIREKTLLSSAEVKGKRAPLCLRAGGSSVSLQRIWGSYISEAPKSTEWVFLNSLCSFHSLGTMWNRLPLKPQII